jgi:hypothetical protein
MHLKILFLSLFLAFTANLLAQTRWIAHKSHSGSDAHLKMAATNDLFDDGSNFGVAPEPQVMSSKLDSVIFLSDSVVVMVTSLHCQFRHNGDESLWQAGRDTVLRHPLFSVGLSLSEIKRRLKRDYYFKNPVDSIKFIGYRKKQMMPPTPPQQPREPNQQQQATPPNQQQLPTAPNQQQPNQEKRQDFPMMPGVGASPGSGFSTGWMLALIGCLALCTGFIFWLLQRFSGYAKPA